MAVLNKLVYVFICFSISACSTANKTFVIPESTLDKGSVVYLYRPYNVSNILLKPEISIDDSIAVQLNNGEYHQLYLQPGEHIVSMLPIEGYTQASQLRLDVKPASVHYLRLASSLSMETGVRYSAFKREFDITEISSELALVQLGSCRDANARSVDNAGVKKIVESTDNEVTGSRFSLEKTRNPFSR